MKVKIQNQLDEIDNQLQELVKRLSKHSEEDLNRKPSEEEWSVMEVMIHLQLAEFYKHPIFGRLDAIGLLKFYLLHIKRHEKQMNLLLSYYKC